ncbi:zinc finger protein 37-like isoform X1 [Ruditapes philippinarum]|uniref:zinc finger protein 37-like isoform X1 n=2 Tax=Ruditapes philippinarum TaxID=129788 RepID=UPI00295BE490|nr:zinc finger protein 37-like isoform X1 [Ruditapes philippinarum]
MEMSDNLITRVRKINADKRKIYHKDHHSLRLVTSVWERWVRLKSELPFQTHDNFATILMDHWVKFRHRDDDGAMNTATEKDLPPMSPQRETEAVPQSSKDSEDIDNQSNQTSHVEETSSNRDIFTERKAICVHTEILNLANLRIKRICSQKFCNKPVSVAAKYIGTSVQLKWTCSNNHHVHTWNSQPDINNIPPMDVLLTCLLPASDYPAVNITFRRIGIEIMPPATCMLYRAGEDITGTTDSYNTSVKMEPGCHNMNIDTQQEYLSVTGDGNVKTENDDYNDETDTSVDIMYGDGEVKMEVLHDVEEAGGISDSETDSATDEEFTEVLNQLNNARNLLKIPEVGDSHSQDCVIKSARMRKKGFRPNYAALEWKGETEIEENLKSKMSKVVRGTKYVRKNKKDPDFDISFAADYDGSDGDESGDDVHVIDTKITEGNKSVAEPNTDEQSKKIPKKRKYETRKEGMKKKSTTKKQKKVVEIKKPWIKIQLADHEDKYRTEKMESFERKNRGIDASENLYSCLVCQHFKCSTKDVIENHIEKHINKALECDNCQYIGYCKADLREHRIKCCNIVKALFVCEICGTSAHSIESKRNHMGRVHDVPEWRCRFCPDLSKSVGDRLDHMRKVHPELCQYCVACKQSKYQLKKEEFEHHKKNCASKEQCEICGQLITLGGMNKHVHDKHENVRKYQCEKCPYAAKSFKRLKTHLYSHDNIHPFSCDQCTFTCVQKYQLVSHMRTHTGEKPYKCTQCKYAAAWNVQLKEHVKVHAMDTAIMCEKCEVMFKNEKTRNIHLKKRQCVA